MNARTSIVTAALLAATASCSGFRPFPLKAAMWQDVDKRPFTTEPEEYFSSFYWDGADQMAFRPMAKFFAVRPGGESANVNALDEVPDSSWFTNRIGRFPYPPEKVALGACAGAPPLDPAQGPWTVTGAKPNGANPGFPIKAADGRRYLLKFDGTLQGPRATAADTIVSKLYHAAGFSTPCNQIVEFDRSVLQIKEGATSETASGEKVPLTEADLDKVFSKAIRLPDGRYRGSASLFLPGKPIGPFQYEGTRCDDPNDVIPHEDRRELRASYVLAAWTNHFDSREQNTLDMYVSEEGKGGYIQHSIIDFGDCFGSIWEPPTMGRRIGHSSYFDGKDTFVDFITLGAIERPWDTARYGESGRVFAYFQVDRFVPDEWKPGYPNPAMLRMTERDAAWMARILARFSDAHVKAAIGAGKITDPFLVGELTRVLIGRRDKLLGRYLSVLSPLTDPEVKQTAGGAELCLTDRAVEAQVLHPEQRRYAATAYRTLSLDRARLGPVRTSAPRVCVDLPAIDGASDEEPKYLVVDVVGFSGSQPRYPARVHLYQRSGADYRVAGLERPADEDPPD